MKKVLIAIDYDQTAQKVAEAGLSLAKSMGAEVYLLHVLSDPAYYHSIDDSSVMGFSGPMLIDLLQTNSIDDIKKASLQFLEKLKHYLGDDAIQTLVKEGDSADSILSTAKELKADIIVMGSHSKKWLENIIMGSVTEKVLRHSQIPLFIVPTRKLS